jgi:Fuc2NAc and GlcNAc transferase
MPILITFPIAALMSAIATRLVMSYARKRLIDQVNERSSHQMATPRGGGLGLVIGLLVAWLPIAWWLGAGLPVAGLALGIMGMAALGWWDDHSNLSASRRLPVQLALVAAACLIGGLPSHITFAQNFTIPVLSWWYLPVAILGGAWLVNLTNFMDGIDGIAGTQGAIGCVGLALLLPAESITVRILLLACAGACVGFLVWNWPPAKIFMGDVGSTTLGLIFAIGVLEGLRHGVALELLILPLAPFVADATCTLARRAWHRERLSQAHRSHLYQRLASWRGSHRPVTILYGILALLGLGLSLATQQAFLPSGAGVMIWLALWILLVLFARRVCPVLVINCG